MEKVFRIIVAVFSAVLLSTGAFAQTAEEILAKVDAQTNRPADEGSYFVMEMKIPLLGTFSSDVYTRGEKIRMEVNDAGKRSISFIDGETHWDYDPAKNEIVIKTVPKDKPSNAQENMQMIKGFGNGYTPSIRKETDDAWYIRCTKDRDNPDKDAPKRMDLVVLKPDCRLQSVSASASIVTITMRDFDFGVPESKVTFDAAEFPGATIVDNR